jgi:hypothetical protein
VIGVHAPEFGFEKEREVDELAGLRTLCNVNSAATAYPTVVLKH